jgi:hypothetical protein
MTKIPPRERALFIALIVSFALWNLPFGGFLLYPFKLLATWMHEMCHGLAMLVSGAGFRELEIFDDTSGIARARRGIGDAGRALIACAGYMGTAAIGALMLFFERTALGARISLGLLGSLLGLSAAVLISNRFGVVVASVGAIFCVGFALWPRAKVPVYLLNFIAAQSACNAVLDIRVLYRSELMINGRPSGASDAHNMANSTFGTPTMWATLWLLWSLGVLYAALRLRYLRSQHSEMSQVKLP